MKSKSNTGERDHFQILDVMLNHFLYGKSERFAHYKVKNSLSAVLNELELHPEKAIVYLDKFVTELLQENLNTQEILALVKLYQCSEDKIIINKLISQQKKSYPFKFQNFPMDLTDEEITNTLLQRRFVPVHIFTFILNRFFNVISFLHVSNEKTISVDQYNFLLALCYNNYDVPELSKNSSMIELLCHRSNQNFFTEQDAQDYKSWIKSEIDKQPRYNLI